MLELAAATDAEPGIITIILSFLNLRELHNAASVCHLWRSSVPGAYLEWQNATHWEIAWSSSVGLQVASECTELCAMRESDSLPKVVMPDAESARLVRMLVAAMTAGRTAFLDRGASGRGASDFQSVRVKIFTVLTQQLFNPKT